MDSTVAVRNRFALFDDDDCDPLEILRQQEEEKLKRKSEKLQLKDKGKSVKSTKQVPSPKKPLEAPKAVTVVPPVETANKPRPKPERFNKGGDTYQESREGEKNLRNRDEHFTTEQKDREPEFRRGGRGGGFRGGRGGRERGGGRPFYPNNDNRPPRRMFDRHSGSDRTGVRPVEKREGAGSNNWGDFKSEFKDQKEMSNWGEEEETERPRDSGGEELNETKELDKSGNDESVEGKENAEQSGGEEQPAESVVKEMTLDEWKKEQEAKRAVPKYNLRKPGEGEDDKQWKKSYKLQKKAKEEDQDDEEEDDEEDEARKGPHKVLLDIQFSYTDSRRGGRGRGRGGRGGPRGPPRDDRRVGPRSNLKSKQAAPRVDDFNDFPTLKCA